MKNLYIGIVILLVSIISIGCASTGSISKKSVTQTGIVIDQEKNINIEERNTIVTTAPITIKEDEPVTNKTVSPIFIKNFSDNRLSEKSKTTTVNDNIVKKSSIKLKTTTSLQSKELKEEAILLEGILKKQNDIKEALAIKEPTIKKEADSEEIGFISEKKVTFNTFLREGWAYDLMLLFALPVLLGLLIFSYYLIRSRVNKKNRPLVYEKLAAKLLALTGDNTPHIFQSNNGFFEKFSFYLQGSGEIFIVSVQIYGLDKNLVFIPTRPGKTFALEQAKKITQEDLAYCLLPHLEHSSYYNTIAENINLNEKTNGDMIKAIVKKCIETKNRMIVWNVSKSTTENI